MFPCGLGRGITERPWVRTVVLIKVAGEPGVAEPKHDTLRHIEIPEGVEIHLRVAGPVVRALAWLIDALIIFGLMIFASLITQISAMAVGAAAQGFHYLMVFAILTFYWVIFEVFFGGATPGKRSMGIYVTKPSGEPVGLQESLLRNLLRFVDFLPLFYGFGLASCLLSRNFQRLGDLAANTVVAYVDPPPPPHRSTAVPPTPPLIHLQPEEQQAIVSFADRSATWSAQRREELATHAEALTHAHGPHAVEKLQGMASWIREGTGV